MEWGVVVGEARAESLVGDAGEAVVGVTGESGESGESDVWVRQAVAWRTAAACYKVMLTPLPAASLTACLASSLRLLHGKL